MNECQHDWASVRVSDHLSDGPITINMYYHYEKECLKCGRRKDWNE